MMTFRQWLADWLQPFINIFHRTHGPLFEGLEEDSTMKWRGGMLSDFLGLLNLIIAQESMRFFISSWRVTYACSRSQHLALP